MDTCFQLQLKVGVGRLCEVIRDNWSRRLAQPIGSCRAQVSEGQVASRGPLLFLLGAKN